jgi:hypothetical protein
MTEMKTELRQVSESTPEASLRDHYLLIDRPKDKGGQGTIGGRAFPSLNRRLFHERCALELVERLGSYNLWYQCLLVQPIGYGSRFYA